MWDEKDALEAAFTLGKRFANYSSSRGSSFKKAKRTKLGQRGRGNKTLYKRKQKRKGKRKYKGKPFTKRQVQTISRMLQGPSIPRILYHEESGTLTTSQNQASYKELSLATRQGLDDVLVSHVRVNDAGAVSSTDISSSTSYNTNLKIRQVLSRMYFRNNSDTAFYLEIFKVVCKKSSGESPLNLIEEGLEKKALGLNTSPEAYVLINPTNSKKFNDYYKIIHKEKIFVPGGASMYRNFLHKPYKNFSTESLSTQATNIQRVSHYWLLKVYGDVAHDLTNVTTEVGLSEAQLDYVLIDRYSYTISDFQTPAALQTISSLDAFTNGGVQYRTAMEEATGDK